MDKHLDSLARRIADARKLVVMTGAGMSAESGVPTFRDASEGLWAKYDPMTLATPEAFERDPLLVWNWYLHRRRQLDKTQPNAGHYALAELQELIPQVVVVTQNVDGLHKRAGSKLVRELHGTLYGTKRFDNGQRVDYDWPEDLSDFEFAADTLPRCAQSGALLRPDIVWFGESLPGATLQQAFEDAVSADVALVIGTSGMVYPAAQLPIESMRAGVFTAEINPNESSFSHQVDAFFCAKSGEVLPAVVATVRTLV